MVQYGKKLKKILDGNSIIFVQSLKKNESSYKINYINYFLFILLFYLLFI